MSQCGIVIRKVNINTMKHCNDDDDDDYGYDYSVLQYFVQVFLTKLLNYEILFYGWYIVEQK